MDELSAEEITQEDGTQAVFHTKDVYRHLGFTRETLRYYEEIELISPKRSRDSQYREFDFFDMSHLMAIDFYRKRGFTPMEIKNLLKAEKQEEYDRVIQRQIESLHGKLDELQSMLRQLERAKEFCQYATEKEGEFSIRKMPPYYVQESIPSVASFGEYRDKVLSYLNLDNEDILSNMVRAITFDKTGYTGSEMYIVKPFTKAEQAKQTVILEGEECLYTTLIADNNDNSIIEKMFPLCHEWAAKHQVAFRGVVYIFIRFVMLKERTDRNYYEIWIPLK